ncbi:hypothetical protein A9Q87_07520 [Flavobacteriales bacterium 34_180_T64]|nr:hypothetical protein A9Q87_07520 [Flavobacteriales bacterium 34_180_T64]
MKSTNYILLLILLFCFGCKNEVSKLEFKYQDRTDILICDGLNTELLKEALISFEEDIFDTYDSERRLYNRSYSRFIGEAVNNKVDFTTVVSEHTKRVFEALQKDESLWDLQNTNSYLNHKHKILACIGDNMLDEDLKETFNALIHANSMSVRMFADPLKTKTATIKEDRYLALFIALDYYYAKLHDVDFSTPESEKTKKEPLK